MRDDALAPPDIASIHRAGRSKATVNKAARTLKAAFNVAMKRSRYIATNPFSQFKARKAKCGSPRYVTSSEFVALLDAAASRVVVSVAEHHADELMARAADAGVPARAVGRTGGARLHIMVDGVSVIDLAVTEAERIWDTGLSRYFVHQAA